MHVLVVNQKRDRCIVAKIFQQCSYGKIFCILIRSCLLLVPMTFTMTDAFRFSSTDEKNRKVTVNKAKRLHAHGK